MPTTLLGAGVDGTKLDADLWTTPGDGTQPMAPSPRDKPTQVRDARPEWGQFR